MKMIRTSLIAAAAVLVIGGGAAFVLLYHRHSTTTSEAVQPIKNAAPSSSRVTATTQSVTPPSPATSGENTTPSIAASTPASSPQGSPTPAVPRSGDAGGT